MILSTIRRFFAPVAVAFLVYVVWDARVSLLETFRNCDPLLLAAAIGAWSLIHLVSPLLPTIVFRARDHALTYATAADIHIKNLPARYIPGGIWHTVGRITGFRDLGVGQLDIAIFVFLENILAISVAFVIGGSVVASFRELEGWGLIAAFAAVGGLVLLLVCPFVLSHRVVKGDTRFELRDYMTCIGLAGLSWCVGAAAFVFYIAAFPELDLRTSPIETGGVYLFSWGVGFVSVFAPQGIGIFEVVAGELLGGAESLKTSVALLVGFRLVILVADGLTWTVRQALRVGLLPNQFGK